MAIIENSDFVINVKNPDDLRIMFNALSREVLRMASDNITKEDIIIKINMD